MKLHAFVELFSLSGGRTIQVLYEKILTLTYNELYLKQIFELRHSPSSGTKTNENVEKDTIKEMLSQIE